MFFHGQGTDQDYSEAMEWYRKAAEQGYADAQVSLDRMLENGQGTGKMAHD
jgi:TPR repeat protein